MQHSRGIPSNLLFGPCAAGSRQHTKWFVPRSRQLSRPPAALPGAMSGGDDNLPRHGLQRAGPWASARPKIGCLSPVAWSHKGKGVRSFIATCSKKT